MSYMCTDHFRISKQSVVSDNMMRSNESVSNTRHTRQTQLSHDDSVGNQCQHCQQLHTLHAIILARFLGRSGGGLCRLARARNASATRCECDWIIPFQPGVSITSVAWLHTHTNKHCSLSQCQSTAIYIIHNDIIVTTFWQFTPAEWCSGKALDLGCRFNSYRDKVV